MSFGYLAATETPADRATLWSFVPATRTELVTGALAGVYAWFRWRSPWMVGLAGFTGAKMPVITALILVGDALQRTRRRYAEG